MYISFTTIARESCICVCECVCVFWSRVGCNIKVNIIMILKLEKKTSSSKYFLNRPIRDSDYNDEN